MMAASLTNTPEVLVKPFGNPLTPFGLPPGGGGELVEIALDILRVFFKRAVVEQAQELFAGAQDFPGSGRF